MTIFQYRCNACRQTVDSTHRGDALGPCPVCTTGTLQRRWAVNVKPAMQEHFNTTTNTVVSSMAGFKADLRRAGAEYSERTGMDCDFQPREWGEMGATDEGIDRANVEREARNLPPLEIPKAS